MIESDLRSNTFAMSENVKYIRVDQWKLSFNNMWDRKWCWDSKNYCIWDFNSRFENES